MLEETWALNPSVALRPEPFGALAYHFGNRKLLFLKSLELLAVIRRLGDGRVVRTALEEAGVPERQWPAYADALRGLADSDMIRRTA